MMTKIAVSCECTCMYLSVVKYRCIKDGAGGGGGLTLLPCL